MKISQQLIPVALFLGCSAAAETPFCNGGITTPVALGDAVQVTVDVGGFGLGRPAASGTVSIRAGDFAATGPLASGEAVFNFRATAVGTIAVTGRYSGDANYDPADCSMPSLSVTRASVGVAFTPPGRYEYGQHPRYTVTVAGVGALRATPTGSVTVLDGTSPVATLPLDSAGVADATLPTLGPGDHRMSVRYPGDAQFAPAQSLESIVTVTKVFTQTHLSFAGPLGSNIVRAIVTANSGIPTGELEFRDKGLLIATTVLDSTGWAMYYPPNPWPGSHSITASYLGSAIDLPSTSDPLIATDPAASVPTSTTLSAATTSMTFGGSATIQAAVQSSGGTPTGSVALLDNSAPTATAPLDATGRASFLYRPPSAGAHSLAASYAGVGAFASSVSPPVVVQVSKAPTAASLSGPPAATVGQTVSLKCVVTSSAGTPTGGVIFSASGTQLGTANLANGEATIALVVPAGAIAVTARYSGDANFDASSSNAVALQSSKTEATIAITSSANPIRAGMPVTLTAIVAPVPQVAGGTVTWLDGGAVIGQSVVDSTGRSALKIDSLVTGAHAIKAQFSGSAAASAASSGVLTLVVAEGDTPLTIVSAASGTAGLAAGSLAAVYGSGLATETATASTIPLPLQLAGATAIITDSYGRSAAAGLVFVSPSQVNLAIPDQSGIGPAKLSLNSAGGARTADIVIDSTAPGLFAANANGKGAAAAHIMTVHPNGSTEVRETFACGAEGCRTPAVCIGSAGDRAFLILYGTGIRNASLQDVSVSIGGARLMPAYAGAQGTYQGLDQVNVELPPELARAGVATVTVRAEGRVSNMVEVNLCERP